MRGKNLLGAKYISFNLVAWKKKKKYKSFRNYKK